MRFVTTRSGLKEIIETYWNVNGTGISYVSTSGGEIIETYWNVNYVQNIRQPRQRMK